MRALIDGMADCLQFAAHDEWERALVVSSDTEENNRLSSWLEQAPADIAMEVFLGSAQGRQQFLGVSLRTLSDERRRQFCVTSSSA